jgi:pSer/pThr/pTyr-binding forkhead associated (FHA) protein
MEALEPGSAGEKLPAAFLVVDGSRYVPLERTVINLGRRRDNTIVLDDPRVSRQHCQLRFRFGQFVLYDLGSRGGTFVNNARVSECVLRPGDVISLAGVPVVYMVEEGTTGRSSGDARDTQMHLDPVDVEEDEDL